MQHEELAALEAEVAIARAARISTKSRSSYHSSIIRFITWLFVNKPHLLLTNFARELQSGPQGPTRESIKLALAQAPANSPIAFDQLTALDFATWVFSMKKEDGSYHAFSTYAGHRSALSCLFRDYNYTMTKEMQDALSETFGGLEKRIARAIGAGDGDVKVGKDPLPFSLYRRFASDMLRATSRDLAFA